MKKSHLSVFALCAIVFSLQTLPIRIFAQKQNKLDKYLNLLYQLESINKKGEKYEELDRLRKSLSTTKRKIADLLAENPDELQKLAESNSSLAEKFINNLPVSDLPSSCELEKIICGLIEKRSEKISDKIKRKNFLINYLDNSSVCFGTKPTLKLWDKMQSIKLPQGTPEKKIGGVFYKKYGRMIFKNIKSIVEMLDNFEEENDSTSKNLKAYLVCFKATIKGQKIDDHEYDFKGVSPDELISQEIDFVETFVPAIKKEKNEFKEMDIAKFFQHIAEQGGRRDNIGCEGIIQSITTGGVDEDSPQIIIENKKKEIQYILSFPSFSDKKFILETGILGGFYLGKIIRNKKGKILGMISIKIKLLNHNFKQFFKKEMMTKIYGFSDYYLKECKQVRNEYQKMLDEESKKDMIYDPDLD